MNDYADGFFDLFKTGVNNALEIDRQESIADIDRKARAADTQKYLTDNGRTIRAGTASGSFTSAAVGGIPVMWLVLGGFAVLALLLLGRR